MTEPYVSPPDHGEWVWFVRCHTTKTADGQAGLWPVTARHRAGAKQRFAASIGDEISIVEWVDVLAPGEAERYLSERAPVHLCHHCGAEFASHGGAVDHRRRAHGGRS